MRDTSPVTTTIARLIAAGVTEGERVARILLQFPDLSLAELSEALQIAQAAAECRALRPH